MTQFNMTYQEVLNSPFQRLILLANSRYRQTPHKIKEQKNATDILTFVKQNNLL